MRKHLIATLTAITLSNIGFATIVHASNGLITQKSTHNVTATADKLVSILNKKGMTVFARINHTEGAKKVGKTLRPTELVIFGNPKVGTPLMLCSQSVAIDLPQKALIWEDKAGDTWLSYNDPNYLNTRHDLKDCGPVLEKVTGALKKITQAAIN